MREKNPDVATGEKKKFKLSPPQVGRAGSKKTAFANFPEICKQYANWIVWPWGTEGLDAVGLGGVALYSYMSVRRTPLSRIPVGC